MMYGFKNEDGIWIAPVNLVKRYRDTFDFDKLPAYKLAQHHWYPCDVVNYRPGPGQTRSKNPVSITYTYGRLRATYALYDTSKSVIINNYSKMVDTYIRNVVRSRGYTSVESLAKYASRPQSPFYAESAALSSWVNDCWTTCYTLIAEAELANERYVSDLYKKLPKFVYNIG